MLYYFFEYLTQFYSGFDVFRYLTLRIILSALTALTLSLLIGPMIIKIVSVPVFWILNALGTLVSGIAIKKGYATELARGRIMTLALLIGMVIGYIIGNIIPLQ